MINRDFYLKQLINSRFNGFPKVITGIRRCGKSYLLNELYRRFLLLDGVEPGSIIQIDLDEAKNASLRNPFNLCKYVMDKTEGKERCYVFIDEIQKVFTVINPALTEGKTVLATEKDKEVVSFVECLKSLTRRTLICISLVRIQRGSPLILSLISAIRQRIFTSSRFPLRNTMIMFKEMLLLRLIAILNSAACL